MHSLSGTPFTDIRSSSTVLPAEEARPSGYTLLHMAGTTFIPSLPSPPGVDQRGQQLRCDPTSSCNAPSPPIRLLLFPYGGCKASKSSQLPREDPDSIPKKTPACILDETSWVPAKSGRRRRL